MTCRQVPCTTLDPLPHPRPPDPSPTSLPPLWLDLDPQRQHRLASHLATLIRRLHGAANPQKESNHEQRCDVPLEADG
jgi:hypothetical protein